MGSFDATLAGLAGAAAVAWAFLGAARAHERRLDLALRGLLGGGAAYGIALSAYDLIGLAGLGPLWERMVGGGWRAAGAALLIGLVEEAAKLCGIALAVRAPARPRDTMALTLGVAAGVAALETVVNLSGTPFLPALGRALFAPVAHALLAVPLGFAVAATARGGWRLGLWAVPAALATAALLHGFGDLALASPHLGRLGFAAALIAPLLALWLHARRLAPQPAVVRPDGPPRTRG